MNSFDVNRLNYQRILTSLFLVSTFLLAINKIDDTDTWMHLSFGRLIWELKGLPAKEPFIYPSFDMPFSYTSWLFGLIYYMVFRVFNVYGMILLKAITVTTAFFILLKDSLRPYKNYIVAIAVMTMVVLVSRHRFVERPDTFLMIFLSFSIYSLNAFVYDNKKYIYALPFIHMLWANIHSSINLMFIPFMSFIVGGILQQFLSKKGTNFLITPSTSQLKTITLIFLTSFAATLINPHPISQYTYGAGVLASDWWRQVVTELKPPTWQTTKWPYFLTAAVVISFILNWFAVHRSQSTAKDKNYPSLIHLFLVIPFVFLSFTAIRFIFLLGIVSGPVLARNISPFFTLPLWERVRARGTFGLRLAIALVAIWIILYSTFSIIKAGPFDIRRKEFGFGINYAKFPEGALKYMDMKGITGRIFNTFHWGGYITWRDFPGRSAFIDGRGYLPNDLLEKWSIALWEPSVMDEIYKTYGCESILIDYFTIAGISDVLSETNSLLLHPDWALVYWDDQSLLYLKRAGKYDSVIREDEYRFIKPADGIYGIAVAKLDDEYYRSNIIRELKRNIEETGSSKAYAFLGFIYNEIGLYREAIDAFSKVRDFPLLSHLLDSYKGIAYAYGKLGYLDESVKYYKKALATKKDAATLYNIGIVYIKKGDRKAAVKYLKKALDLNSNLMYVYPALIGIYNELGMGDDARRTTKMYERATIINKGEELYKNGIKAYREKRFDDAVQEFKKSIEVNPSSPAPYSSLGLIYYDMGMIDAAYEYQKKAIEIDPDFANAHYRLALIYKKLGDNKMAKRHWKEYLRVEPVGYFSRRAREELKLIDKDLS